MTAVTVQITLAGRALSRCPIPSGRDVNSYRTSFKTMQGDIRASEIYTAEHKGTFSHPSICTIALFLLLWIPEDIRERKMQEESILVGCL